MMSSILVQSGEPAQMDSAALFLSQWCAAGQLYTEIDSAPAGIKLAGDCEDTLQLGYLQLCFDGAEESEEAAL